MGGRFRLQRGAVHAAGIRFGAQQPCGADLHTGRIDPRQIRAEFTALPARDFDPAAYLKAALAAPHFADALRAAAPRVPLYASLRALLAHYRTLADHPAWATPLPPLPGKRKLEPGQPWAGLPQLTQRLVALGDLPEGTQPTPTYDTALQEGVKAFQQRRRAVCLSTGRGGR